MGRNFLEIIVDRGYRGHSKVGKSELILPGSRPGKHVYARRQHKLRCRRRSAIEVVICHLKSGHSRKKVFYTTEQELAEG